MRYSLISRSAGVTRHRILRSPDFPRKNALRRSLRDRPFGSFFFLFPNETRKKRRSPNPTLPPSLLIITSNAFFSTPRARFFPFSRRLASIFSAPRPTKQATPTTQNSENASTRQTTRQKPNRSNGPNRPDNQESQKAQTEKRPKRKKSTPPRPPKKARNAKKRTRSFERVRFLSSFRKSGGAVKRVPVDPTVQIVATVLVALVDRTVKSCFRSVRPLSCRTGRPACTEPEPERFRPGRRSSRSRVRRRRKRTERRRRKPV